MAIFLQFLPLLILGSIVGAVMAWAAIRLGKNPVLWFFLTAIPIINFFAFPILAWRTMINLHDRLKALEAGSQGDRAP